MKKTWGVLLGLALALPMAAYVAGSLASASDDPGDHSPIRIVETTDDPSTSPSEGPSGEPSGKPSGTPTGKKTGKPPRITSAPETRKDDTGPETVIVRPDDLDDDDDDDGRDDDDDDDDDGDD